ncbi:diadenylate cyclase [Bacillus nitratireducens]|uniref:diadenylate cyclase n=1 Tax=Bacillus nitratireducens TaxID=2026193 RepID=UPI002E79A654|nr:hypothetical protein [Bacillus nitratireducens]
MRITPTFKLIPTESNIDNEKEIIAVIREVIRKIISRFYNNLEELALPFEVNIIYGNIEYGIFDAFSSRLIEKEVIELLRDLTYDAHKNIKVKTIGNEEHYYLKLKTEMFNVFKNCFIEVKIKINTKGSRLYEEDLLFRINTIKLLEDVNTWFSQQYSINFDLDGDKYYEFDFDDTYSNSKVIINESVNRFLMDITNYKLNLSALEEYANLKYEGSEANGSMYLVTREDMKKTNIILKFKNPIPLNQTRKVRKLLETTSNDLHLIVNKDTGEIKGLGNIKDNKDLLRINFIKYQQWELFFSGEKLISSSSYNILFGDYGRAKQKAEFESFFKVGSIFSDFNTHKDELWKIVESAMGQKHGTMLVISDIAEKESKRLENESFNIEPKYLEKPIMYSISNIDGAVLINPECYCFSMGVILDGLSYIDTETDIARGARYNSAHRYLKTLKNNIYKHEKFKTLIVIVSEDGMTNYISESN